MIGHIQGEVLFSDGTEAIILTASGVGYQVYCNHVLAEGTRAGVFISHVFKDAGEELYAFRTLKEKKLFELLTTVRGTGPKSANALMKVLSVEDICNAIAFENKKLLTSAPGIGPKAAAQMILDLQNKIHKVQMFGDGYVCDHVIVPTAEKQIELPTPQAPSASNAMVEEAIMACKELGFNEAKVIPLIQKIVSSEEVTKSEQLVHLVLKEL